MKANDKTHHQELTNAPKDQDRLRNRLATSDLRLSVLLAAPGSGSGVPAASSTSGVVYGAARGELDPAAAQRIVAITGDGDEGLMALRACQAYVMAVAR
ncbi:Bacteriophage lysis protein [compost metagenome]